MTGIQELDRMLNQTPAAQGSDTPTEAIPKITSNSNPIPKKPGARSPIPKPPKKAPSEKPITAQPSPVGFDDNRSPASYDTRQLDMLKTVGVILGTGFVTAAVIASITQASPVVGWTLAGIGILGVIVYACANMMQQQIIVDSIAHLYRITIIQQGMGADLHQIRIRYITPHASRIRDAIIVHNHGLAWLVDVKDGQTIIPRDK